MDPARDRQEDVEFRLSQYLDGGLDDADRAELEAKLSADPQLRTELEALQRADQLVQTWGRQIPAVDAERFVAEAARRRGAYERSRRVVRFYRWSGPLAAAAVLALVVTGYLVVRTVTHSQIAPAPPVVMVRVGPSTVGAAPDRQREVIAHVRFSRSRSVEPIKPGHRGSTLLVAAAGAEVRDTVSDNDYDDEPPWL
jgi:anti-sigma factor RsiW